MMPPSSELRKGAGPRRAAVVLPIVLAVAVILGLLTFSVYLLRQQTYRGLNVLDGHLDAVSVGEACFVGIVDRLRQGRWSERWFKDGPKSGAGRFLEGRYEYLIGDGPQAGTVDLVVWAYSGQSQVSMHWRLIVDPYTLSPYREVRTIYFEFGEDPEGGQPALGPIVGTVGPALQERQANQEWVETMKGRLLAGGGADVPGLLNLPGTADLTHLPDPGADGPPTPVEPLRIGLDESELGNLPPAPFPEAASGLASPASLVNGARAVADALQSSEDAGQAADFMREARDEARRLADDLSALCIAHSGPECQYFREIHDQILGPSVEDQQRLNRGSRELRDAAERARADLARPGLTEADAQRVTRELRDRIEGSPDPCDAVEGIMQDIQRIVPECAELVGGYQDLVPDLRRGARGLRGKGEACRP